MVKIIKEACIGSLADAKNYLDTAKINQINRIETCSNLDQGGLTPELEVFNYIKSKNVEQVIMIRRHHSFMIQSEAELKQLIDDLNFYLDQGATNFIFGYLTKTNEVDVLTCQKLIEQIKLRNNDQLNWSFHMAIDAANDYDQAFKTIINLGFTRVLTKGGQTPAINNLENLKRLNQVYGNQIEIIVGGKVTDQNCQTIIEKTGIKQVHGVKIA